MHGAQESQTGHERAKSSAFLAWVGAAGIASVGEVIGVPDPIVIVAAFATGAATYRYAPNVHQWVQRRSQENQ